MFKIKSRFYVIYGDGVPIYVGFTSRTVHERFLEHKRDKDFSDFDKVEVKELKKDELDLDFSWDYSIIESEADKVSKKEAELVKKFGTQDSEFQKADGGGEVWTHIKYFVLSNKDNPKYNKMNGREIHEYLENRKREIIILGSLVGRIKYPSKVILEDFINHIEHPSKVILKSFISRVQYSSKVILKNFIKNVEYPSKVILNSFDGRFQYPSKVILDHFVGHIEYPSKVILHTFISRVQCPNKVILSDFIKNVEHPSKIILKSFISRVQYLNKVIVSDFIKNIKHPSKIILDNFVGNMKIKKGEINYD